MSARDLSPAGAAAVRPGGALASEPIGPATVELHVEELALHGFAASERERIGEAMRAELTRLIVEEGIPARLAHARWLPEVDAGSFDLGSGIGAEAIGRRVARSVYEGLSG